MDLMEDVSPNENGGDFDCHVSSPEGKPLKTNINTKMTPCLKKEIHFPKPIIFGIYVSDKKKPGCLVFI